MVKVYIRTEIAHFYVTVRIEQNIGRFYIPIKHYHVELGYESA